VALKWTTRAWILIAIAALVLPLGASASTRRTTKRRAHKAAPAAASVQKPAAKTSSQASLKTTSKSTRRIRGRHPASKGRLTVTAKQRRSMIRPEPNRITEIQKALTQAGYYSVVASGKWDDQTRDAMRRYQLDHGFPATGLPEAKSLMKLGLGPHALPDDLVAARSSRGGAPPPAAPKVTSEVEAESKTTAP
jgi:hypothetical protein